MEWSSFFLVSLEVWLITPFFAQQGSRVTFKGFSPTDSVDFFLAFRLQIEIDLGNLQNLADLLFYLIFKRADLRCFDDQNTVDIDYFKLLN